ncbi:hypothetical protein ZWY2020_005582 [Hordeum vulgare]|nr:hypothetical protein ZWY2020_051626 [Hordeum vulgare]KAI5015955.1 hypothetical protein ZWY2020_005582 [Hordeum vulgare]
MFLAENTMVPTAATPTRMQASHAIEMAMPHNAIHATPAVSETGADRTPFPDVSRTGAIGTTMSTLAVANARPAVVHNSCGSRLQTRVYRRLHGNFVLPSTAPKAASSSPGGDESGGYVKGLVTYMVTDGLEVTPMSAISSITLINKFSVNKDVELAEKFVSVGMDEGLGLLRAALRSDTVLSDVFLAKKK